MTLWALLVTAVFVTLLNTRHVLIFSIPVLLLCAWYGYRVLKNDWPFLKNRQWRLFNGRFTLQYDGRAEFKHLKVEPVYIRPNFVVLKFQIEKTWYWDILLKPNCDSEGFRQLKASLTVFRASPIKD